MEAGRSILIVGLASVALFAWLFRFEVQSGNGMVVMKYDRWTGHAESCVPGGCVTIPK
jgi:hypothetical protein